MDERNKASVFNRVGFAMCILEGFTFIVQVMAMVLATIMKPEWLESMGFMLGLSVISFDLVAFPVFVFYITNVVEKTNLQKSKLGVGKFIMFFFISFAVMNLSNYISVAFGALFTFVTGQKLGGVLDDVLGEVTIMTVLATVVFAPIFEELTFRYFALNRLRRFGDKTAIIVTAVLFGLFHMNFEQGIYATAIGIVFGYVACRTGRIRYTILLHALINFFSGVLPMLVAELNTPIVELVYLFIYFGFIIVGIILFAMNVSKVKLEKGTEYLSHPVKTAIVNPGMLIFIIFAVVNMILTLAIQILGAFTNIV